MNIYCLIPPSRNPLKKCYASAAALGLAIIGIQGVPEKISKSKRNLN